MFWRPATPSASELRGGEIGDTQADAMSAVSIDYERWVNHVIGWIRRKGTKVWALRVSGPHQAHTISRRSSEATSGLGGDL
jgi:hypothetical protein